MGIHVYIVSTYIINVNGLASFFDKWRSLENDI